MMAYKKTAALLIGFGGPTSMAEVRPFIESVLEGIQIPESRLEEVVHHYEKFNGVSPYNKITQSQKEALENWFEKKGEQIPVYIGLRHSSPTFREVFDEMKRDGVEKVIGFVLSSFRCYTSFEKYVKKLEEAKVAAGAEAIEMIYTAPFFRNPLFIEAQVERIRNVGAIHELPLQNETFFLFSAHSIPVPMADESGYADQFIKASSSIAKTLGLSHWAHGYQSRSLPTGRQAVIPWLSPDVKEVIQPLDIKQVRNVMLIPVGFLCDNVEVLYDLDVEAKESAEKKGLHYSRASTVMDHPKFIEMIGSQILEKIKPKVLCQ